MHVKSNDKRECCFMERKYLRRELRECDFCSTGYDEHHRCYRDAARKSGHRGRGCMEAWLSYVMDPIQDASAAESEREEALVR